MTSTPTTKSSEQIEQYRKEAEEAKKALNFEFAFLLLDKADSLEKQEKQFE